MKVTGMPFKGPLVRALLDGSKTQTRRVVKLQRLAGNHFEGGATGVEFDGFRIPRDCGPATARFSAEAVGGGAYLSEEIHCPYGQPGDRIWVRETLGYKADTGHFYAATGMHVGALLDYELEPPPSVGLPARVIADAHMPRWTSRILLEIVSVRVERLQDISDADITAEGIDMEALAESQDRYDIVCKGSGASGRATERTAWRDLWESTGGDWEANPWCWAITFKWVTQ